MSLSSYRFKFLAVLVITVLSGCPVKDGDDDSLSESGVDSADLHDTVASTSSTTNASSTS